MIIKKIFENNSDEEVHSDFLKFGRGEYPNKYVVEAKKQKENYSVKTGPEYANGLVKSCLRTANSKIAVKGAVISTGEMDLGFPISGKGGFMGVKKLVIDAELEPQKVLAAMDKYPRAFFALTFSTPTCELKIKPKAPKSAKPSTAPAEGGKEKKMDFCSLKTQDKNIVGELLFGLPAEFKEARIKHTLKIVDIIYPKNEKDPVKVREMSKRKGVLVREAEVDGTKSVKEAAFES